MYDCFHIWYIMSYTYSTFLDYLGIIFQQCDQYEYYIIKMYITDKSILNSDGHRQRPHHTDARIPPKSHLLHGECPSRWALLSVSCQIKCVHVLCVTAMIQSTLEYCLLIEESMLMYRRGSQYNVSV